MLIPDKNRKSPTGQITSVKRYSDPAITIPVSDNNHEVAQYGEENVSGYLTESSHDALPSDNPHTVTFTQAVTSDAGTNITASEAETLTDGSNADSLHTHDTTLLRDPVTDFWDPTTGLPTDPLVGDRYIASDTGNGWTQDYIYEWDGESWIEEEPDEGWMVWMLLEFMFYFFFSGGWVEADSKVGVDSAATPGYLGEASDDGVLRTSSPLTYTDGGDYVTIGIQNAPQSHIVDADGSLADITTKFNTLLSQLETLGLLDAS